MDETGSGPFILFVFLVIAPAFESDSNSLPTDVQSEALYLQSNEVEVMLISRVIRSVGLDNDGKSVQR